MTDSNDSTRDLVYAALETVIDPEIGLDIVTLGLVYDVQVNGSAVDVTFTLTTRGCPMEAPIRSGIMNALADLPGITDVNPHLVWTPRWTPEFAKEGAL